MYLLLAISLVFAGALAVAVIVIHMGFKAPRVVQDKNPTDYGLDFETLKIPTSNGRMLHGWLMPPTNGQATSTSLDASLDAPSGEPTGDR